MPHYASIMSAIHKKKADQKFYAIKCIQRRLRAANDESKSLIAARMIIRIAEGRVA